jgi:hypothetical protein
LNLSSLTTAESQQTLNAAFDELKPAEHEWRQLLRLTVLRIPFEEVDNLTGEQLSTNALQEVFTQPNVRLRRLSQLIRLHQLKQYVG